RSPARSDKKNAPRPTTRRRRQKLALALLLGARTAGLPGRLGAQPVELVAVAQHREAAQARRDLLLQALDLVVLELEDQPALHADQVIVVISDDLVARLAVAELALDGEAAVHQ